MKKFSSFLLCVIASLVVLPVAAHADSGPKPSVVIEFEGLAQADCYVTLLSKRESTGPYSAYDGNSGNARYEEGDEDYRIWEKFVSYRDKDGYYFLQYFSKLDDTATFKWGYYPPEDFKILLYFPGEDRFIVSDGAYERYAFDSYYKVDASGLNPAATESGLALHAVRNYHSTGEAVSFLARVLITIAIELLIALPFGFRSRRQLWIIALTNIVTQTVLNVLLNLINYSYGPLLLLLNYFWLELLVITAEAVVYSFKLGQYSRKPKPSRGAPVFYAFVANIVSFAAGLGLAYLIPGIF
jgi:hypothetical protein